MITGEQRNSGLNVIQGIHQSHELHATNSESEQPCHKQVLACVKQKPITAVNIMYVDVTALFLFVRPHSEPPV